MEFEEAERLHQRVARIAGRTGGRRGFCRARTGRAGRRGRGAIRRGRDAIQLWFLIGGCWQAPQLLYLTENMGAGRERA